MASMRDAFTKASEAFVENCSSRIMGYRGHLIPGMTSQALA